MGGGKAAPLSRHPLGAAPPLPRGLPPARGGPSAPSLRAVPIPACCTVPPPPTPFAPQHRPRTHRPAPFRWQSGTSERGGAAPCRAGSGRGGSRWSSGPRAQSGASSWGPIPTCCRPDAAGALAWRCFGKASQLLLRSGGDGSIPVCISWCQTVPLAAPSPSLPIPASHGAGGFNGTSIGTEANSPQEPAWNRRAHRWGCALSQLCSG